MATYYVLFFLQLETRGVTLAGITRHPTADWMVQMSRNATDGESDHLVSQRYLLVAWLAQSTRLGVITSQETPSFVSCQYNT